MTLPPPVIDTRPAPGSHVLVVEDDPLALEVTGNFIRDLGVSVIGATGVAEAADAIDLHRRSLRLVISDVKLRDGSGLELFRRIRAQSPALPVILITGFGNTEQAVSAMKEGAFYYFTKPVDFQLLTRVVREALEKQALAAQVEHLSARLTTLSRSAVLGSSPAIHRVLDEAAAVAGLDTTVLLIGETGTGKELFAEHLHRTSPRRNHPLVAVNCAAVPEPLLESELFGHERGAFTGAVGRKPGKFEMANGGSLLLDEISDLAPALQAKLLRVVETKRVEPLGATRSIPIDVRLIATSHSDLSQLVEAGRFRADLFYRLEVFPIVLPPLRERVEDVALLANHFLRDFAEQHRKVFTGFDYAALAALAAYRWPGNVRELRHIVERAVILAPGPLVGTAHLPSRILSIERVSERSVPMSARLGSANGVMPLERLHREAVLAALAAAGGNRTRAAQALGITRNQIRYFLRKLSPPGQS